METNIIKRQESSGLDYIMHVWKNRNSYDADVLIVDYLPLLTTEGFDEAKVLAERLGTIVTTCIQKQKD